jgi:hypothetical protein
MKIKHALIMAIGTALLIACNQEKKPPAVADYFNPVVDGQPMSPEAYLARYCDPRQQGFSDPELHCRYVEKARHLRPTTSLFGGPSVTEAQNRAELEKLIQYDKGRK